MLVCSVVELFVLLPSGRSCYPVGVDSHSVDHFCDVIHLCELSCCKIQLYITLLCSVACMLAAVFAGVSPANHNMF